MADQLSQQVKKPLHHHNQLDMDELSVTLIERRKRLHELASEINQWEDEETKRLANATAALMNQSPSTNTTMNNTTTTPFAVSPSPRLGGLRQTSPSPHHYHLTPTNNNNKENRTPTNSVGKLAASAVTPGSNEILSVAKRILTKKQSSSEPTALSQPSQTVKSIASKFETLTTSGDESSVVVQEKLTPRSIIQKFEKMASGGSAHSALSSVHKKPSENNIHKVKSINCTSRPK